ncbi:hypothetical protein J6590_008291 [Homalodisca vitripennis]|nr:hypothetical protein J6590_008291 [Homalodisca vitripennis]
MSLIPVKTSLNRQIPGKRVAYSETQTLSKLNDNSKTPHWSESGHPPGDLMSSGAYCLCPPEAPGSQFTIDVSWISRPQYLVIFNKSLLSRERRPSDLSGPMNREVCGGRNHNNHTSPLHPQHSGIVTAQLKARFNRIVCFKEVLAQSA